MNFHRNVSIWFLNKLFNISFTKKILNPLISSRSLHVALTHHQIYKTVIVIVYRNNYAQLECLILQCFVPYSE